MGQYGDFDRGNPNYERNVHNAELIEKRRNKSRKKHVQWDSGDSAMLFIIAVVFFALIIADIIPKIRL